MPLNPCGRLVDFARRPYTTRCRFFRDSDTESEIIWYPCRDDAPDLGISSPFVSHEDDVSEDAWGMPFRTGLGEVWDAPRTFNGRKVIPQATGAHRCGTDDEWRNGALFNPDRPPILYQPNGLPTCCLPGKGLFWFGGPPAPAGGVKWYEGGAFGNIDGGDTCAEAPELTYAVEFTQIARLLGPTSPFLWFVSPSNPGPRSLDIEDLGGVNPVANVQQWAGTSCGTVHFITSLGPPPIHEVISGTPGEFTYLVIQPDDLTVGAPCPLFTIRLT